MEAAKSCKDADGACTMQPISDAACLSPRISGRRSQSAVMDAAAWVVLKAAFTHSAYPEILQPPLFSKNFRFPREGHAPALLSGRKRSGPARIRAKIRSLIRESRKNRCQDCGPKKKKRLASVRQHSFWPCRRAKRLMFNSCEVGNSPNCSAIGEAIHIGREMLFKYVPQLPALPHPFGRPA